MNKRLIAAVIALTSAFSVAHGSVFNFAYTLEIGDTLEGQLDGMLQADGNTVVVGSILDFVTFNGVDLPSFPYVESFDDHANYVMIALDPKVTIDGSFMDLIACTDSDCLDGFLFAAGNEYATLNGPEFSTPGPQEDFNAERWSLTQVAVPEPATLALFGLGLAGLGAVRRKKLAA